MRLPGPRAARRLLVTPGVGRHPAQRRLCWQPATGLPSGQRVEVPQRPRSGRPYLPTYLEALGPVGPLSDRVDLVRLRALGALADGVLHLLVLCQGAVAAHVDRGVMDEDVGGAIIGGDKTVALVRVEPFHGSLSHLAVSFEGRAGNPRTLRGSAAGRSPPKENPPAKRNAHLSKPRA